MKPPRFFVIALLALCACCLSALPAAAQAPLTVRIAAVDAAAHPFVTLRLAVRDAHGVPIPNLNAAAFDLSEDRTLQSRPIHSVQPVVDAAAPVSLVLAVDVSGSMKGAKLRDAQEAIRRFLDGLGAQDAAALITFAGAIDLDAVDPAREQPFGGAPAGLYAVVEGLSADGATPLYDAAYKAVTWAAGQPNRAVLLFTDGKEEKTPDGAGGSRVANEDSAVRIANAGGVPVFTIGLGADADEAYLRRLALETGGLYQHASQSAELAQLFRNVSDLLKQQYEIVYESGLPADGQMHQVLALVRVGEHQDFAEAPLGPLPLASVALAATPTPAPAPTAAPTPTAALPLAAPPSLAPAARTPLALAGLPLLTWAGILGGVLLLGLFGGLAVRQRRRQTPPVSHRCLRCGHELPAAEALCPACGYGRSFTEQTP